MIQAAVFFIRSFSQFLGLILGTEIPLSDDVSIYVFDVALFVFLMFMFIKLFKVATHEQHVGKRG